MAHYTLAMGAVLSPDGAWLAFLSDETGRAEVYIQAFETGPEPRLKGGKVQVSRDGGSVIRWRPDGKELFYLNSEDWLVSVPISIKGRFTLGQPQPLFRAETPPRNLGGSGPDWGFDVSSDGARFLMMDGSDWGPVPLVVMQNWQQALHR